MTAPIVRSSTFAASSADELADRFDGGEGFVYSRLSNPTVEALEARIASLEGAEAALATASGMGAIHVTLMSQLAPGARVVVDPCVYGCTFSLLERLEAWGVEIVPCDTTSEDALAEALAGGADLVFVETPMNPTLRVVDLDRAAELADEAGATLVVDNTFATPACQRPLAHGADLVVHSLTKAVNGASDALAGAVCGDAERLGPIAAWRKDAGPVLDPETAWLVLRGAETLDLRVEQACESALELAARLEDDGWAVEHPLLPWHEDHDVARGQMSGCSVFTVDVGTRRAAMDLIDGLELFERAVSLGGIESLVCHPASTTHAVVPEAARAEAGIGEGLVRFSVGIEPLDELAGDLTRALGRLPLSTMASA